MMKNWIGWQVELLEDFREEVLIPNHVKGNPILGSANLRNKQYSGHNKTGCSSEHLVYYDYSFFDIVTVSHPKVYIPHLFLLRNMPVASASFL